MTRSVTGPPDRRVIRRIFMESTSSPSHRRGLDPLPLMRASIYGAMFYIVSDTPADPDLWGHVRFGRDILDAGVLPAAEPYAFTSDRPWVNHEYLAEVLMYGSYALGGAAGLVRLKLMLVLGTFPETELHAFVTGNSLEGHVLTWFDWGEYAI